MATTAPGVLHHGLLGVARKGKVEQRYFVLRKDRLDYYNSIEDAQANVEPRGRLAMRDVEELEVLGNGFKIVVSDNPSRSRSLELQVPKEKDLEPWINALEPLLETGSEEGSSSGEEVEEAVLFESPLSISHQGKMVQKHFWLFEDRLEITNTASDVVGEEHIPFSDILGVSLSETGFSVRLPKGILNLHTDRETATKWVKSINEAVKGKKGGSASPAGPPGASMARRRSRQGAAAGPAAAPATGATAASAAPVAAKAPAAAPAGASAARVAAVVQPPAEPPPAGKATGPAARGEAPAAKAGLSPPRSKTAGHLGPPPRSADDRKASTPSALSPRGQAAKIMSRGPQPLCEGYLAIFRKGRMDKRYFVLFNDSLEYWTERADREEGKERRGCVLLSDIERLEDTDDGVLLRLKGDRLLDLRCQDPKELETWLDKWNDVMVHFAPGVCMLRRKQEAIMSKSTTQQAKPDVTALRRKMKTAVQHNGTMYVVRSKEKAAEKSGGMMSVLEFVNVVRKELGVQDAAVSDAELRAIFGSMPQAGEGTVKVADFVRLFNTEAASAPVAPPSPRQAPATAAVLPGASAKAAATATPAAAPSESLPRRFVGWKAPAAGTAISHIFRGDLGIPKKGGIETRHFVLFPDRFEYFNTGDDFDGGTKPRGMVLLQDVMDLAMLPAPDRGFNLSLQGDKSVQLFATVPAEMSKWQRAWEKVFDFRPAENPGKGTWPSIADEAPQVKPPSPKTPPPRGHATSARSAAKASAAPPTTSVLSPSTSPSPRQAAASPARTPSPRPAASPRTVSPRTAAAAAKALASPAPAAAPDIKSEALDVDEDDPEELRRKIEAAVKIQARHRGKMIRKAATPKLKELKAAKAAAAEGEAEGGEEGGSVVRQGVIRQGWLGIERRGKLDRRPFILFDNRIEYYTDSFTGQEPRARILLSDIQEIDALEGQRGFTLSLLDRTLTLVTQNKEDFGEWWLCLDKAMANRSVPEKPPAPPPPTRQAKTAAPPRPPPLPGALFEAPLGLQGAGGALEPRYFALFSDRLDSWMSADAARRDAPPQERIMRAAVEDLEIVDGGFDVRAAGRLYQLRGVDANSEGQWTDALAKVFGDDPVPLPGPAGSPEGNSGVPRLLWQSMLEIIFAGVGEWRYFALYEDCLANFSTANAMVEGSPPQSRIPLKSITTLEVGTEGFVLNVDDGNRLDLRVSSEPGLLEAWMTAWQKVPGINITAEGPTESAAKKEKPFLVPADVTEDRVYRQGMIEVERGTHVELRFVTLFQDRLLSYKDRAGKDRGDHPKRYRLNDIDEFKVMNMGFYLEIQHDPIRLHCRRKEDFEGWRAAFGELLRPPDEEDQEDSGSQPGGRGLKEVSAVAVYNGPLMLSVNGRPEKRHCTLYPDRFEYSTEGKKGGLSSPSTAVKQQKGVVNVGSIRGFRILDHGFVIRTDNSELELSVLQNKDLEEWTTAFRGVFTGRYPIQRPAETGGAVRGRPNIRIVDTAAGQGAAEQRGRSPQAPSTPSLKTRCRGCGAEIRSEAFACGNCGMKQLADVEEEANKKQVPIYQGPLWIQHRGHLVKRFFFLFKDRLDYFDNSTDLSLNLPPRGRIALIEVLGHEVFGTGFILNLLGRRVGLKADTDHEIKQWDAALREVLAELRPLRGVPPAVDNPSFGGGSTSRSNTPKRDVKPRVYSHLHTHSRCPSCGSGYNSSLTPRAKSAPPGEERAAESPPVSPAPTTRTLERALSSRPEKQLPVHADTGGWVQINTFDKWRQRDGRFWKSREVSHKLPQRESTLREAWHPMKWTVIQKVNIRDKPFMVSREPGEYTMHKIGDTPPAAKKVNAKKLHDERMDYHYMPPKVTDPGRSFLVREGPDLEFANVTGKITNAPAPNRPASTWA